MSENDEKYTIFHHLSFINSKNVAPIQREFNKQVQNYEMSL